MKPIKPVIGLSLALGLLLFAVPRLEIGTDGTLSQLFSIVWLGMVLLIVAAHLHQLLGADEQARKEAERVRLYKKWRTQQWIERAGRTGRMN